MGKSNNFYPFENLQDSSNNISTLLPGYFLCRLRWKIPVELLVFSLCIEISSDIGAFQNRKSELFILEDKYSLGTKMHVFMIIKTKI